MDPSSTVAWEGDLFLTGSLALDLAILVVALGLSAFFSSAETALTALSEARAQALIEAKPRKNRALKLWLERPNRVLTTILIGNNVVNTFTAALATLVAQAVFADAALSIAVGVTTVAILIAGEITPKTFAKHNAERMAPVAMKIIAVLYHLLIWAVVPFTLMSKGLVKVFGGEVTRTGPFVTEEDIAFMLQLSAQEGVIEEHEEKLITSVLEFGDTVVREVMIPRTDISGLKVTATLDEVLATIKESGHTRMPVYGESVDDVVGIFHTKELLKQLEDGSDKFNLKKSAHKPYFVPELMKISELLKEFQRRKTHMAIVVDEYGGTSGIVCLEDIIEELVGEIHDEYDDEEEELRKIGEGRYIATGKAAIYDVAAELSINIPDDSGYESVGGFLIAQAGKMPTVGQRIGYEDWLFVVTGADSRKVSRVEIVRMAKTESGSYERVQTSEPDESSGKSAKAAAARPPGSSGSSPKAETPPDKEPLVH